MLSLWIQFSKSWPTPQSNLFSFQKYILDWGNMHKDKHIGVILQEWLLIESFKVMKYFNM